MDSNNLIEQILNIDAGAQEQVSNAEATARSILKGAKKQCADIQEKYRLQSENRLLKFREESERFAADEVREIIREQDSKSRRLEEIAANCQIEWEKEILESVLGEDLAAYE